MTAITHGPATVDPTDDDASPASRSRGVVFWITRYLPAEIVGTAVMIIAGLGVTIWTAHPAAVAVAGLLGETLGFYALLAVSVYVEQAPVSRTRPVALGRTMMLLVAEFGAAALLDTLLIRPALLMAGVWLLADPLWGLLGGKILADVVFYAIAAGAFTLTARTGLRDGSRRPEERSS